MAALANTPTLSERHEPVELAVNAGEIETAIRAYRARCAGKAGWTREHAKLFAAVMASVPSSRADALAGMEFVINDLSVMQCQPEHVALLRRCFVKLAMGA